MAISTRPDGPHYAVYFAQARHATAVHALTVSVAAVAAITVACLAMAWLLPAKAPAEDW